MFTTLVQALGLNSTFFIQFLIFLILFPVLAKGLIGPYFKLNLLREKETKKRMESAARWKEKKSLLETDYQKKAQTIHADFQKIFKAKSQVLESEFAEKKQKALEELKKENQRKLSLLDQELKEAEALLIKEAEALSESAFQRLVS